MPKTTAVMPGWSSPHSPGTLTTAQMTVYYDDTAKAYNGYSREQAGIAGDGEMLNLIKGSIAEHPLLIMINIIKHY